MYRWVWVTMKCYTMELVNKGLILGTSKWYTVREDCVKEGRDWIKTQTYHPDSIIDEHYTAPYMLIQEADPTELKVESQSEKLCRWLLAFLDRMYRRLDKEDGYVEKMSSKYFMDPEECFKDGEEWFKNSDVLWPCSSTVYVFVEHLDLDKNDSQCLSN
jgi:hypothetical protein